MLLMYDDHESVAVTYRIWSIIGDGFLGKV